MKGKWRSKQNNVLSEGKTINKNLSGLNDEGVKNNLWNQYTYKYIMSHENKVYRLIYFSLQVTGWSSNPSLTTSRLDEAKDHQCSFYNTYRFKNIIHIGFRYHKTRKYHILNPTLLLTQIYRPCGDASWRHLNLSSQANISHNHSLGRENYHISLYAAST